MITARMQKACRTSALHLTATHNLGQDICASMPTLLDFKEGSRPSRAFMSFSRRSLSALLSCPMSVRYCGRAALSAATSMTS